MTKSVLILSALCLAFLLPSVPASADQSKLDKAFKKADKDNDGTLDRAEAKALPRVAKNFDQIDTDKKGTVSLDEIYASARKIDKKIKQLNKAKFEAADKDHDGTLDRQEAKTFPSIAKNFDKIDVDKEGTVSQKEIDDFVRSRSRHHPVSASAPRK